MDTTGLDDIFEGGQQGEPAQEPATEPPAEPAQGDDAAATPAAKEEPEQSVPLKALLAEREKRQAYERRLQEIQEQNRPDPNEDPEAWRESVQAEVAAARVDLSWDMASQTIEDFEKVMSEHWKDYAERTPGAYERAVGSSNPAKAAYDMVKADLVVKEVGDPVKYREKLKAEILAELNKQPAPKPDLPSSLASVPNAAGRSAPPPDNGPTPLDQILPKT